MASMSTETPSAARRGVFVAEVRRNDRICDEHYLLRLAPASFPATRPGQFVQLQCRGPADQVTAHLIEWGPDRPPRFTQPELIGTEPLLRRPFSLAADRRSGEGVELDIIYRTIGTGTRWLGEVEAGAELSVLGPLGNSFAIREGPTRAAVVGGGVGIPPMLHLAEALAAAGKTVVAFSGARSANLLPLTLAGPDAPRKDAAASRCVAEFTDRGAESVVATDDGSVGVKGFVDQPLGRWMDKTGIGGEDLVVCACGPEPMMRAVGELCIARGVECQLALERHMACGMGTCQSCVVKIRADNERGWEFKLCCTDGPVFDARDIVWE